MIAFANGILDVRSYIESGTTDFMRPTPAWFSQTYCPYKFDPDAVHHAKPFLDFLHEILNGDQQSIDLIQEWIGYCMTSDNRFEKFMMFVGRPASGKGATMDVMAEVISAINIFFARVSQVGSKFGLYGALGKTNIFMTDAHAHHFETATAFLENLKTSTDRGPIDVEGKGTNVFSQLLITRFTMSVNELPKLNDLATALGRRLLLAWFPNSYEGREDHNLKRRLTDPSVIQGVAAWALEGLRRLWITGRFTEPESSRPLAAAFQRVNSPIGSFVNERCTLSGEACVSKDQLFEAWVRFCSDHDIPPSTKGVFAGWLYDAFVNIKPGKEGPTGKQVPVFRGLALKPEYALPAAHPANIQPR